MEPPVDNFPFWSFSIDRYMRPGVSTVCLNLQARHQLDVNIVLFSLWLADQNYAGDQNSFVALIAKAEELHTNVVRALRLVRQKLKLTTYGLPEDQAEAFRTSIKAQELAAEKLEQQLLFSTFLSMPVVELQDREKNLDKQSNSRRILDIYYAHLGLSQSGADLRDLAELIDLCHPNAET